MRAVVQRVSAASVRVEDREVSTIGPGLLVLLGVHRDDTPGDAGYLVDKICHLRIFPDESGQMNLSVQETGGALLVVSQFTLYGDCRKGRRPSYGSAAGPERAKALYDDFLDGARKRGLAVAAGEFQAMMEVSLVNSGPVTILLDSAKAF